MSTKNKKCGVCREIGHTRSDCEVLKEGLRAKKKREEKHNAAAAKERFVAELARARKLAEERERERGEGFGPSLASSFSDYQRIRSLIRKAMTASTDQQRRDATFEMEAMKREIEAKLVARLGREEFEKEAAKVSAEFEKLMMGIGRPPGGVDLAGFAAISEKDLPDFLREMEGGEMTEERFRKAVAKCGGVEMDPPRASESMDEYWARMQQGEDKGLN